MSREVWIPLVSGGMAGTMVELTIFPLDTIKTRLQSANGFRASGGFCGIYRGVLSSAIGSFPSAAAFFCAYEGSKSFLQPNINNSSLVHMVSASIGVVVSCVIRVPSEVVKQRAQANKNLSSYAALLSTIKQEGIRGLYRGYFKTVMREATFAFIRFPVWELMKEKMKKSSTEKLSAFQSGVAGAISAVMAGAITTPLDVVKTRVMLAETESEIAKSGITKTLIKIGREEGLAKLYSGISIRIIWLGLGGFVYLGTYDKCKTILETL